MENELRRLLAHFVQSPKVAWTVAYALQEQRNEETKDAVRLREIGNLKPIIKNI
jgi:hypothetical protein